LAFLSKHAPLQYFVTFVNVLIQDFLTRGKIFLLVLKTSRDTDSLHFREVTMAEVEEAARFANAHDFITSFREDVSISSELKSINKILAGVKYV
jgi:hypothetical protein